MINWGFHVTNNNIFTLLILLQIPEIIWLIHTMEVFIEFTRFLVGVLIKINVSTYFRCNVSKTIAQTVKASRLYLKGLIKKKSIVK